MSRTRESSDSYWRITSTLGFDDWLDILFGYGLLAAEFYALIVLIFGYLQTAWPLRRQPVLMSTPPSEWPVVDVFIPTYNEALDIVKVTIFAALRKMSGRFFLSHNILGPTDCEVSALPQRSSMRSAPIAASSSSISTAARVSTP